MTEYEKRLWVIAEEVLEEMKSIGIYPSAPIIRVKENRRAKKRLGSCRFAEEGREKGFVLEISSMMESCSDGEIKEVMAHELLHTCKGCLNHGAVWKALAEKMNRVFGYHIQRIAHSDFLNTEEKEPVYRYCIQCQKCGNTIYRLRKSNLVKKPGRYRCARCGGRLKVTEI